MPRTLIEIWSVFACIVVPLWLLRRPPLDPRRDAGYWFWPTTACVVAAVLAQAVYLPSRIAELGGFKMPASVGCSETQEMFLAAVLSLYVASIAYRARQMGGPG